MDVRDIVVQDLSTQLKEGRTRDRVYVATIDLVRTVVLALLDANTAVAEAQDVDDFTEAWLEESTVVHDLAVLMGLEPVPTDEGKYVVDTGEGVVIANRKEDEDVPEHAAVRTARSGKDDVRGEVTEPSDSGL